MQRGAGGGQHIAWLTGELLHQICYSRFYLSVVDLPPYLTFYLLGQVKRTAGGRAGRIYQ